MIFGVAPSAPIAAETSQAQKRAKMLIEMLVLNIRGGEGLDLSPYAKRQIRQIAMRVADRISRGLYPSLAKNDAVLLYKLAKRG